MDSASRTPQQTHTAVFWQSNPAANWNSIARGLADSRTLGVTDSALLFAMMDLTTADAIINCWNDKHYITPPYPDHPSGALCFNSSSAHAVQAFLGTDELDFYSTSSRFPLEQRHFDRFSDMIRELIEARIWAGIHYRNADVQGALVGEQVARYTRLHYFQPLH